MCTVISVNASKISVAFKRVEGTGKFLMPLLPHFIFFCRNLLPTYFLLGVFSAQTPLPFMHLCSFLSSLHVKFFSPTYSLLIE